MLYSPGDINKGFRTAFQNLDWKPHIQTYYLTPDEQLAYQTMALPSAEQKEIIEANGGTAFYSYNQTDFLK